ncbi:hypothetical protein [uncultured Hyphomonas sp.]|uniref:hypothetical protein n=1 Tax=uncultured Hyphomonas sp. TaxID=225298 RepID=UPI0037486DDC
MRKERRRVVISTGPALNILLIIFLSVRECFDCGEPLQTSQSLGCGTPPTLIAETANVIFDTIAQLPADFPAVNIADLAHGAPCDRSLFVNRICGMPFYSDNAR